MNKKINVLHMGCRLFDGRLGFIASLVEFMKKDPRVTLDPAHAKKFRSQLFSKDEMPERITNLNHYLAEPGIAEEIKNSEEAYHIFNFMMPQGKDSIELRLEAFGLADIICIQDSSKQSKLVELARTRLQQPYDILGLCPFCAGDILKISEKTARRMANYDASRSITSDRIVELTREERNNLEDNKRYLAFMGGIT
jgi:hypothetical protein